MKRVQRTALLLIVLAGCLGLTNLGCSEQSGYPDTLVYPQRTDPLVTVRPTAELDRLPAPGNLDQAIARVTEFGGNLLRPDELPPAELAQLRELLDDQFGRPAAPKLPRSNELSVDEPGLAEGALIYKRLCLHCHGLTGDGRGPTGAWVQPHPRDLRQGEFKFVSTQGTGSRKPSREDLRSLIREGLPGSQMPPFRLLSDGEIERLVDYVIHLSVRGQTEFDVLLGLSEASELGEQSDVTTDTQFARERVIEQWLRAEQSPILPEAEPKAATGEARFSDEHLASVRRGHGLFRSVGCVKCHADFGRKAKYRFDVWGTTVRPRDLTQEVYRGGGRPIDLYRRIRGGIGPSGMPSHASLPEKDLWDLVHFVEALPYPERLPPDVRSAVYP